MTKGEFRRILVFSALPLSLSLPVVRCLSLVTIPGNKVRFKMEKGKIWLIVVFLLFFLRYLLCRFFSFIEACWL